MARLASAETTNENTRSIIVGNNNPFVSETLKDTDDDHDYSSNLMTKVTPMVSVEHLQIVGEKDEFGGESSNDNNENNYGSAGLPDGAGGYGQVGNGFTNTTKLLQSAEFTDMFGAGRPG